MLSLLIGVVGNCAAGKSTLVNSLRSKGYQAINIPQEHSVSKRFWRRLAPDIVVYLSCGLEAARKRRNIQWGQERLDEQWNVLSDVRENAHLVVPTDELTQQQVLALVEQFIAQYVQKETEHAKNNYSG